MLSFKKELYYTGKEDRKSKNTGNEYTILNFLGENGQSFSAMADGLTRDMFEMLQQMELVSATFLFSQYMNNWNVKVISIEM